MNTPIIVFPERSGDYKFLQFESFNKELFLRFGDIDDYHAEILEAFSKETGAKLTANELFPDTPIFDPASGYFTIGGGKSEVNLEKKIALFGSHSGQYGFFDRNKMIQIYSSYPDWTFDFTKRFNDEYDRE